MKPRRTCIAILAATSFAGIAHASVIDATWIGFAGGNWTIPSKWSTNTVPNNDATNTYRIFINDTDPAPRTTIVAGNLFFVVDEVTIGVDAQLDTRNSAVVKNKLDVNGIVLISQDQTLTMGSSNAITGAGTIQMEPNGRLTSNSGTLNIGSGIKLPSIVNCTIGDPTQHLQNAGRISGQSTTTTVSSRKLYTIAGASMLNAGTLEVSGTHSMRVDVAGELRNTGWINAGATSTITLATGGLVNQGVIQADGTILFQSPITNFGTIALGKSQALAHALHNGQGTVVLNGSTLTLAPVTTNSAEMGRFVGTGTVSMGGAIENTGNTWSIDAASAKHVINNAPYIRGGTLASSGGAQFLVRASPTPLVLDDVSMNATISLSGTLQMPTGQSLQGTGTITGGGIRSQSGALDIGGDITLRGVSVGNVTQPLNNKGHIIGGGIVGTPIKNDGVIESTGPTGFATVFGGVYTRAGLGKLINNGRFGISGTLENTGEVFTIDNASGQWLLLGTIHGGTLRTRDGMALQMGYPYAGTLDDVTLDGDMNVGQSIPLVITNGQLRGSGRISLGPASLDGPTRIISPTGTLTIDPGITVNGGGGFGSFNSTFDGSGLGQSSATHAVINHGTVQADFVSGGGWTNNFDIVADSIFNDGTFAVRQFSSLHAIGDTTFLDGGKLDIEMNAQGGGLLAVTGALHLDSLTDRLTLSRSTNVVPGSFYPIVTASGGITGTFDFVTSGYELVYGGTTISARFVPEPFTFGWLLGGAIVAMTRRRRHPL